MRFLSLLKAQGSFCTDLFARPGSTTDCIVIKINIKPLPTGVGEGVQEIKTYFPSRENRKQEKQSKIRM